MLNRKGRIQVEHRGIARPVVAIAGATGFVGRALMHELQSWYRVIALTRLPVKEPQNRSWTDDTGIEWRECDLFSLIDAEKALEGVNYAFYLVHSMMPSARLTQGKFQDMDLILADNFARAAAKAGVKQIIYLGGLVPDTENLSLHLRSRLEVEETLGSHGVPVTALRAGLIIGAGGSTFRILIRLAQGYRFMIFPRWMMSLTHPIALPDVLSILHYCMGNPKTYNESYDIGGPDVMTYKELIINVARVLNRKCYITVIPYFPPWLASILLGSFTGSPLALVKPLVESLKHPMVATNLRLQQEMKLPGLRFADAVKLAVSPKEPQGKIEPPKPAAKSANNVISVRSVQRLTLPPGRDADWVAIYYSRWIPGLFLGTMIRVKLDQNGCYFYVRFLSQSLLDLTFSHARSSKDRPLYYITGGLLARLNQLPHRGRLEFREVLNNRYVLVAIHDYVPTIPWFFYNATQALLHVWVMGKYGKHLERLAGDVNNKGQ
ncbi:MAG: hypothetical protein VR67_12170 [Peptococcaceae bacterium BRH_c8a]|nr:MAG: hypothetical protein VR67_12170 [Peptococcaceae bacterium BRH_c8a]